MNTMIYTLEERIEVHLYTKKLNNKMKKTEVNKQAIRNDLNTEY